MKSSYTISLVVVTLFCASVIAFYVSRDDPDESPPRMVLDGDGAGDLSGTVRQGKSNPRVARSGGNPNANLKNGNTPGVEFSGQDSAALGVISTTGPDDPGQVAIPPVGLSPLSSSKSSDPDRESTRSGDQGKTTPPTLTFGSTTHDVTPDFPIPRVTDPGGGGDPNDRFNGPSVATGSRHGRGYGSKTYVIRPGDTFSSIAVMFYGSEQRWVDIAQANPLVDPNRVAVGQVIRMPSLEEIRASATRTAPREEGESVYHMVRPGESLHTIAYRYYKSADLWKTIFEVNRENIGPDPGRLKVGLVLTIPPAPSEVREARTPQ